MKKLFLSLAMVFAMIFATTIETQAQSSLYVQGGFSWSEGVVAVGYCGPGLSTSLGFMATQMPGDGSSVNGFVWNLKLSPKWYDSGTYLGYSYNSIGYRSQMNYGSGWGDDVVAGMHIVSIGYKLGLGVCYVAADIGYGWASGVASGMSWGVVLGIPIAGSY